MDYLLSAKQMCERLSMNPATLYRKIRRGEIDAPLKDGPRSKWLESSAQKYIEGLKRQNAA
jgi:predicted DNA-binding transcriptional regulator AlpA